MRKPNFLTWYYNQSLHGLLRIWFGYAGFALRLFSVRLLCLTWLSPWKRDLSRKTWRGFSLELSFQRLVGNIFSRLIGAFLRSWMIVAGLSLSLSLLVAGLVVLLLWLTFPAWAIILPMAGRSLGLAWWEPLAIVLFWAVVSAIFYAIDNNPSFFELETEKISRYKIFDRLRRRLGASSDEFSAKLLADENQRAHFLKTRNLSEEDFQFIFSWEKTRAEKARLLRRFWRRENLHKVLPLGRQWHYGWTVQLDRYVRDLSVGDNSAYRNHVLHGRTDELEILKLLLIRPDQNCALLVGPAGIGKQTLIHQLAREIREQQVGAGLADLRILLLDLGQAISDAINKGEDVENFLRQLFFEAAYAGNVVLVVENLENYLDKGASIFHPDISAVLSEYLPLPSFQLIGLTSPKEYHRLIEKQENVTKHFEVLELKEPDAPTTLEILLDNLEQYESQQVVFSLEALKTILRESQRLNWETPMPERALDLAMDTLTFWQQAGVGEVIDEQAVEEFVAKKTGTPHGEIKEDEKKKLLDLENILHRHVIGQHSAIGQLAEALRRARSGIGNTNKPVGSFLFLGPTGVGKTETAKALAREYFGDENKMVRLDMSEYQAPNSVDRLLGSSQLGQVGHLVEMIKDNPYCLLLLDELEKAYPEILDLFLQVLDEGFLTDAFGEKINFRNTIIIATSNAGAALVKQMVEAGEDLKLGKQKLLDHIVGQGIFRLEFLNRFNGVIIFETLKEQELKSVIKLQLDKFARRIAQEKGMELEFGPQLVDKILTKGYNPVFGARSLNRYIEDTVEDLVAKKIIAGEVRKGEKIVI